jgi:hypothetical protein
MVVDDFHVMGVAVAPNETDPEPVVDSDAVLAPSIAAQGFEPVPGKDRQVPEFSRCVELVEFPLSHASDRLKPARRPPVEEPLNFFAPERSDHNIGGYNARRYTSSAIRGRPFYLSPRPVRRVCSSVRRKAGAPQGLECDTLVGGTAFGRVATIMGCAAIGLGRLPPESRGLFQRQAPFLLVPCVLRHGVGGSQRRIATG